MKKTLLIFGGGYLQQYLLNNAKDKDLYTVVIDPDSNAYCANKGDVFCVVDGDDFDFTLSIAKKYNVRGIITAATDKPLKMMSIIAGRLNLPFFSEETAQLSTDKLLMKKVFVENNIPCAKGVEIYKPNQYKGGFPVIIKPRDNSGSRGVILCNTKEELCSEFNIVKSFTNKKTILIEEYISGREYSIESVHLEGKHIVVQYTEKTTTTFPYNVELKHKQPANIDNELRDKIDKLINKIGNSFGFVNCVSHTELKVTNSKDIYVIETSPRLGGDYITSHLVPLSTGINMEAILIDICMGNKVVLPVAEDNASMILYFNQEPGTIVDESFFQKLNDIKKIKGVTILNFTLKKGEKFPLIKNSLDRYGYIILIAENKDALLLKENEINKILNKN